MSEREIPQTAYLDVDQEAECGREMPTDPPTVCGKAPVVWVAFDSHEDWDGYVATACDEHAADAYFATALGEDDPT